MQELNRMFDQGERKRERERNIERELLRKIIINERERVKKRGREGDIKLCTGSVGV